METAGSSFHGSLSAEEARRILGFLGYGRLSAPVWFIGLEEGLSKQDSVDWAHNLRGRGTWDEGHGPRWCTPSPARGGRTNASFRQTAANADLEMDGEDMSSISGQLWME